MNCRNEKPAGPHDEVQRDRMCPAFSGRRFVRHPFNADSTPGVLAMPEIV